MLFKDYDLLAQSGLFDADYYLATYPDVAGLDPLLHYLEKGASEGRNPHPDFDSAFYQEQCRQRGEAPPNPLVHFLTVGAVRGLKPRAGLEGSALLKKELPAAGGGPELTLYLDWPRVVDGAAERPIAGGITVRGWALSREGVDAIEIAIDGKVIDTARHGFRRDDVAATFPGRADALHSGFAVLVPEWSLPKGDHVMIVRLRDKIGRSALLEFRVRIEQTPDGDGPWSIRRKMSRAEIDLQLRILSAAKWQPVFQVIVRDRGDGRATRRDAAAHEATLASLRAQAYPHFEIVTRLKDVKQRPSFAVLIAAGDVLGCDALLELAMASALHRDADFLYSDERRLNPITKADDAYFKPSWSPDLALTGNYIGRLWCADKRLLQRAGISVEDLASGIEYDVVLRLTEAARRVHHVPKVLCQRAATPIDSAAGERRALQRALQRRKLNATIDRGVVDGTYRVRRTRTTEALVSIIIPTCAARGAIKNCIETLRKQTRYRKFEIICVENIPAHETQWRRWVGANADKVASTTERFNWSRFNHLGVAHASGEFLLFLNDDVEIVDPDWLDVLLSHAERPEVGAVGPLLLYPDQTVQHAGIALTDKPGMGRHPFRHARADDPGYFGLALCERNVVAVTGACLLVRRSTFDAVGGFDESYDIVNNDVDFCLKCWQRGLQNVYTPHTRLIHHELVSRGDFGDAFDTKSFDDRWRDVFLRGDPYLNPNLEARSEHVAPEREPVEVLSPGHPLYALDEIRSILVVKIDHIGDCIASIPALRLLKQRFAKSRITVLCASSTRSVFAAQPEVDELIEFDYFHVRSADGTRDVSEEDLRGLRARLEPRRFDLAIDFRKSPDARHVLKYTGARFLIGFDHRASHPYLDVALEWEGNPGRWDKRQHIGGDLIALVEAAAAAANELERQPMAPLQRRIPLAPALQRRLFARRVICIHPGVGNPTRQWPLAHFIDLIDLLTARHDHHIAIVGSPDESEMARKTEGAVRDRQRLFNLVGELNIPALSAFIAKCALFVGNDSGPKHLAAALGVPTVGIQSGVVDAREWGPNGRNAIAIKRDVVCSPCYIPKREDCPRGMACLTGLTPRVVYLACRPLLLLHDRA